MVTGVMSWSGGFVGKSDYPIIFKILPGAKQWRVTETGEMTKYSRLAHRKQQDDGHSVPFSAPLRTISKMTVATPRGRFRARTDRPPASDVRGRKTSE
jgi:hypothetical protein